MSQPRPASRHSNRPPSSLSHRSISRLSQRPVSRLTVRSGAATAASRHAARVAQLTQTLVAQVTGLNLADDPVAYGKAHEYAARNLDGKIGSTETMQTIEARVQRIARRGRIDNNDNWAKALERCFADLAAHVEKDNDMDREVKASNLADHLHFLLELSAPPRPSTLAHADILLAGGRVAPERSPELTWKTIMDEEPFEGEHWEGIFATSSRHPDSPSISSETESDLGRSSTDLSIESFRSLSPEPEDPAPRLQVVHQPRCISPRLANRVIVEELVARQHWRPECKIDADLDRSLTLADPSTFGPAVARLLDDTRFTHPHEAYINEVDAVRNVLLALQGCSNIVIQFDKRDSGITVKVAPKAPRVVHLSPQSYNSILQRFCIAAQQLSDARSFISAIFSLRKQTPDHSSFRISRTLEAYADGLEEIVLKVERWCASYEEQLLRAQSGHGRALVISLLSLSEAVDGQMHQTFMAVNDILRSIIEPAALPSTSDSPTPIDIIALTRFSPSELSTRLLDGLLESTRAYIQLGEVDTALSLMELFSHSSQPLWKSVGKWLREGMDMSIQPNPSPLEDTEDDELFFCKSAIPLGSADFWENGYTLRTAAEDHQIHAGNGFGGSAVEAPVLVPKMLETIANEILSAGKAIGLLRSLGFSLGLDTKDHPHLVHKSLWPGFAEIIAPLLGDPGADGEEDDDPTIRIQRAIDGVENALGDFILPICQAVNGRLKDVLATECDLWRHLEAMEAMYLMRRGDAMTTFCDVVFAKIDAGHSWYDVHFLNSAFTDLAMLDHRTWIEAPLVHFHHKHNVRDRDPNRTVRAFECISMSYMAPFPLTYILSRPSASIYNDVFTFLMQMRRTKTVVERVLLKGVLKGIDNPAEAELMKPVYAMRGKLAWFINSLMNFILVHVVDVEITKFHAALKKSGSLDAMIRLHDEHLGRLKSRCFLHPKMSALHQAIISIFDLSIAFASQLALFVNSGSLLDTSDATISDLKSKQRKRRRGRRARKLHQNVIGFSLPEPETASESSEDEVEIIEGDDDQKRPPLIHASSSFSFGDESFVQQLDKMSEELDGLVRFVRRSVESFASGVSEAASTFGILSFVLEEWDM